MQFPPGEQKADAAAQFPQVFRERYTNHRWELGLPSRHLRCLSYFPLIGEPGGEFTELCRWQVDQQLGQIQLRIHIMSVRLASVAAVRPPRGLPTNKEFLQFSTVVLLYHSRTNLLRARWF